MTDLPLTNVRLDVLGWLVDNIRAQLPGVQVEAGWPGDREKPETVYAGVVEGTLDDTLILAGRRIYDDNFTVPFEIRCTAKDMDTCRSRLSALVAGLHEVMAGNPTLDEEVPGVLSAHLAQLTTFVGRSPEGPRGYATQDIAVHARSN